MKLLILSIEFPPGPGGLGTLAYQAALHLSERGWDVWVSTPQDHVGQAAIDRFNAAQGFKVCHVDHLEPPLRDGLRRLRVALRAIRERRPDVLLAVGMQAVWLGAALSRLTGVPLVAVGAGTEFVGRSPVGERLNRWAFGRARERIVISDYSRRLMADAGIDVDAGRVNTDSTRAESTSARVDRGAGGTTLVPCGADARRYRPGLESGPLRARLGIGQARVLLTVGQLSERKAQDVVIRALPEVLRVHPEVVYVLVGLPTRGPELERLACELGVCDHVLLTGAVPSDELPAYYNLADLFVLVSRRTQRGEVEGYGIVVAEAALCGVPAVVSRGCGLEEAVLEDQTALLVAPDDPAATAEAIHRFLSDDRVRRTVGDAARRYVLETGTWAQRMSLYDRVLRRAVGER